MSVNFLYEIIYYTICVVFFAIVVNKESNDSAINSYSKSNANLLIAAILVLLIGTRPVQVGSDTTQYIQEYGYLLNNEWSFVWNTENKLFDNLFALFASFGLSIRCFFLFVAAIYFFCMNITCRKVFPENQEIAFVSCLVAFSTFSYGTDGIKAGVGAAVFLVAVAYHERFWFSFLLAFVSIGLHHSMFLAVIAYALARCVTNMKLYYLGWLMSVLIAAAHIGFFQTFFARFVSDKAQGYLLGKSFLTGFRPDFILYSSIPVLIGYLMCFKRNLIDAGYELWLRIYLTTNSVWMLCMYASYTNRIAYISWSMYPIVLLYPYYRLNEGSINTRKKVVKYHLLFTLFMVFVYYGIMELRHESY